MSRARDLADGTFSGAFSADSPTLVVDDANNRVGAGIASPSAPLHVAADSSTLSLRISGRSSDDRSDVEFYENDVLLEPRHLYEHSEIYAENAAENWVIGVIRETGSN